MKKRIITAAVLIPVLILVALVAPTIVAAVVWGLLLAVGVYELLYVTGLVRHLRMVLYSAVMAFAVSLWSLYGAERSVAMLGLLIFWILLFSEMMANHVKVDIEMIASCFFAGAVVPYLLSAIIRILTMTSGRYLIAIPFLIAFLSDGGAYFVGSMFGKHKLAPVISPNKSVEGVAGGIVAAMLGMLIYAVVLCPRLPAGVQVPGGLWCSHALWPGGQCGGRFRRPVLFRGQADVRHQGFRNTASRSRRFL